MRNEIAEFLRATPIPHQKAGVDLTCRWCKYPIHYHEAKTLIIDGPQRFFLHEKDCAWSWQDSLVSRRKT